MSPSNRSKLFLFLFGLIVGFTVFLWIANSPCYNAANIISFFSTKFAPCNAHSLSQEKRKTASLVLIPTVTTIKVGQSFSVSLIVNPTKIDINAVGVRITNTTNTNLIGNDESMSPFPLHLTDLTAASDLKRVVQVIPNPGITATAIVAQFTFVALSTGTATIALSTSSLVLANDGFGTDVLGSVQNATVTIVP